MSCCDDPTEPSQDDHRLLMREQMLYGNLLRDLFIEDPEKLMLKQLADASPYLRELAALNAHYVSVRQRAIQLLHKESAGVLERIYKKEPDTEVGSSAQQRLAELNN